jgi:hypothetical protein
METIILAQDFGWYVALQKVLGARPVTSSACFSACLLSLLSILMKLKLCVWEKYQATDMKTDVWGNFVKAISVKSSN